MDEIINEKKYPVRKIWLLKYSLAYVPIFVILGIFSIFDKEQKFVLIIFAFIVLFYIGIAIWSRRNFHFDVDAEYLIIRQGILNKQEKTMPYGVIQNVFVGQDVLDRVFGLASLVIENAAQGAGVLNISNQSTSDRDAIGFRGNKISVPGLSKSDAEELKIIILQKMKENPIEDSQSGL